jgi:carbamoyl-phosphate synthase large subunit
VPIVSKVTGIALAKIATEIMLGKKISEFGLSNQRPAFYGVKEAVFPFNMFPEVDPLLGPEMRATGEVMGVAPNFGLAFYKSQESAGTKLPTAGTVLLSVSKRERCHLMPIAQQASNLDFKIIATEGTARFLAENGIKATEVKKLHEGRPNLGDMIKNNEINLIINTPIGRDGKFDDSYIRMMAIQNKVPYVTTLAAAKASLKGIDAVSKEAIMPKSLQEYQNS